MGPKTMGKNHEESGHEVFGELRCRNIFEVQVSELINPLNSALFPKLSAMASIYEEYCLDEITFSFKTCSPGTRSGVAWLAIDTDPADAKTPSSVPEVMALQNGAYSAVSQNVSVGYRPKEGWLRTQVSGSQDPGDRTAFVGRFYAGVDPSVAVDDQAVAGYLAVAYRLRFRNFRAPTNAGFELVNNSETALVSGTPFIPVLHSTESAFQNIGTWAGRYIFSPLKYLLGAPTPSSLGLNQLLLLPPDKTTNGVIRASLGGATDEKVVATTSARHTYSSFEPFVARQQPDGTWIYQEVPEGPWYPYSSVKMVTAPLAIGDIQLLITSVNADGTQTVLYNITVNNLAATVASAVWSVIPHVPGTYLRFAVSCAFTTARVLNWFYTGVGPASDSYGG